MTRSREAGFDGRQPAAVSSALAILDVVAQSPPGITANQIRQQVALPRATVYRILGHLVAEEYLVRSPDLRGFALGRRMRELGQNLARHHATEASPDAAAVGDRPARVIGPETS